MSAFDPVDRTLTCAKHPSELGLRPTTMLTGITDETADTAAVIVCHAAYRISDMS